MEVASAHHEQQEGKEWSAENLQARICSASQRDGSQKWMVCSFLALPALPFSFF